MIFNLRKDSGIIPSLLTQILDHCVNGVTLSDPDLEDNPIVYANKAFEDITGFSKEEMIGKNCRFLQGNDKDQPEIQQLREAISNGSAIEVVLRNYRKDGTLFHNHLTITPLHDSDGNLIYFLGVQFDVTAQIEAKNEIADLEQKLETNLKV